ncbi:hypothetical protein AGMMS49992_00640 [Clostridia bacterium]|nr:hypothetical protein AGMMS49992_00640 [Clostridia bacterium]
MRKILTAVLALILVLSLSLGGGALAAINPEAPTGTMGQAKYVDGKRVIRVANWFGFTNPGYYSDLMPEEQAEDFLIRPEAKEAEYNRLLEIEEKYNVKFEFIRTTFDGQQISLDEGVLSGMPEADIYNVDIQFGLTYIVNGYLYALEDLTTPDDDVFTTQQVERALKMDFQDRSYAFADKNSDTTVYMLGFNWTLLQSKGLENPQDLWDRGEWTWDAFIDYCTKLTDITGSTPIYGLGGFWTDELDGFLRSNGANIAASVEGGLLSAATGEVLDLYSKLYVDLKVAQPWNADDWTPNNNYADGHLAFFDAANWILNGTDVYSGGGMAKPLPFEIGVVPYPVGPSGNKDTNTHNKVTGNYWVIPKGVEDPSLVYNAFKEMRDWYGGVWDNIYTYDVIDPDDVPLSWSEQIDVAMALGNEELAENNIRLNNMMMWSVSFDPWGSLSIDTEYGGFSMVPIMNGELTPAQFQETFKQPLAAALEALYK